MKTRSEILAEGQLLEQRVRREFSNLQRALGIPLSDRAVHMAFVLDPMTVRVAEQPTGPFVQITTQRAVIATNVGAGFEYRVNERWTDESPGSSLKPEEKVIAKTASASEALYTAYFSMEAQRLLITLAPFEHSPNLPGDPASEERMGNVESLVNTHLLSVTERMRNRIDVVDFLHGRLTTFDFIRKTLHRLHHRQEQTQTQAQKHDHRQTTGEP